ncbi:MAG: hypothetical protein HYV29_00210 [Ignavibacteriales bacterium]|nr:hypothetical protein [Ignavibacteriales bacterium]
MRTTSLFTVLLAALFIVTATLTAQIITVKTYPILSDQSVLELPSANGGLGGIAFALHDRFAEPYRNPAFITSSKGVAMFVLPRWSGWNLSHTGGTRYTQSGYDYSSQQSASNAQLSIGALTADGTYGIAVATGYQRLRSSLRDGTSGSLPFTSSFNADQHPILVAGGLAITEHISIGALYNYIPLKGFDGIQFLYPRSRTVHVSGSVNEYRLGVSAAFGSSAFDIVAGRNMLDASHGATYEWGPMVENKDENDNIFAQGIFRQEVSEKVSLAATATANWKELPKLPDYPIAGVPRDPGYTRAFNLGGGMTYMMNPSILFAFEYLYEPIMADTWVDALETRTTGSGTIMKGNREQEHNYDFHNHILHLGLQIRPEEWLTLQAGASLHSYSYAYEMKDHLNNISRQSSPENEWTETTLTGGIIAQYGNVQLSYTAEFLTGRGLLEQERIFRWDQAGVRANDVILVPNDFLKIKPVNVMSHRMTVMYAL